MSILSIRLDEELEQRIEFLMNKRKVVDKSAYIRRLLDESTRKDYIDYFCNEVKEKRMTAWKAAEVVRISLRAILSELAIRKVMTYDETAFREDSEFILRE